MTRVLIPSRPFSNFRGELTSVVVDRNPGLVTGLAVAPEIGMLYWSDDDGDALETLYQGRMDGTSIEQIKTFGKVNEQGVLKGTN